MLESVVRHKFSEVIDAPRLEDVEASVFPFEAGTHLFLQLKDIWLYREALHYVFEPSGVETQTGHKGVMYPMQSYGVGALQDLDFRYRYPHAAEINIKDGEVSWEDYGLGCKNKGKIIKAASAVCSFAEQVPDIGREIDIFHTELRMYSALMRNSGSRKLGRGVVTAETAPGYF